MRFLAGLAVAVLVLSLGTACGAAEQGASPSKLFEEEVKADGREEMTQFVQVFTQWKGILDEMRTLRSKYKSADPMYRGELRRRYDELLDQGEDMSRQVLDAAAKAFAATPAVVPDLADFFWFLVVHKLDQEDYGGAYRFAKMLIDRQIPNKSICNLGCVAAYNSNHFEDAERYYKAAKDAKVFDPEIEKEVADLDYYKEVWPREEKLRAAEAKADDLPRVLLKTNKGDIELELFENEAPVAVANFITLVEKKFYNRLAFHRVLPKLMAQTGSPKADGSGGMGYTIPCECYQPNHRLHFAGSLSMANRGRDTGASQFFLTFLPTRHLDGKHTVFGRVIKGMDVLSRIQRIDPSKKDQQEELPSPDGIFEAKVLRKRNHPYEFKKLPE